MLPQHHVLDVKLMVKCFSSTALVYCHATSGTSCGEVASDHSFIFRGTVQIAVRNQILRQRLNSDRSFCYEWPARQLLAETMSAPAPAAAADGVEQHLFVLPETAKCARDGCVVCNYKILLSSRVSFDRQTLKPNERPQNCPRERANSASNSQTTSHSVGGLYRSLVQGTHVTADHEPLRILTVGDGDLSFSLSLARLLDSLQKQRRQSLRFELYATSYESRADLLRIYPSSATILKELEQLGVFVRFNVDACTLRKCLASDIRKGDAAGTALSFHRIVWNFPSIPVVVEKHSKGGSEKNMGYDGQVNQLPENQRMLQRFARECFHLLALCGEVHVTHKTKPPFHWWGIANQMTICHDAGCLAYRGCVAFDRTCYPPYVNRKALDKKSFPCSDAITYIFSRPTLFEQYSTTSNMSWKPLACVASLPSSDIETTRSSEETRYVLMVNVYGTLKSLASHNSLWCGFGALKHTGYFLSTAQ